MHFEISREALIKPLQLVTGVVERRQTLPVLSNVLLVLEKGQLSLTGTDLEVELVGRVNVAAGARDGDHVVEVDDDSHVDQSLAPVFTPEPPGSA